MPDTVIFLKNALAGLLEDGEVDAHDFKDWLTRIETKLDEQNRVAATHGERLATVEAKATSAHKRLDEAMRTLRGPGKPAWVGIIVAMITALAAIVVAYFTGKG